MMRVGAISSKAKLTRGIMAIDATVLCIAKKIGGPSIISSSRTCSNKGSRENEYKDSVL